MAQYIDKDAALIELRILKERVPFYTTFAEQESYKDGVMDALNKIDSLEVKEIDFDKENLTWEDMLIIHKCIKDAMNKYLYAFQTVEGQQKIYEDVLRRFKAQKRE